MCSNSRQPQLRKPMPFLLASSVLRPTLHMACCAAHRRADNHAAWHLVQHALAALQAGVHKAICGMTPHGTMPNPNPSHSTGRQQPHQQQQQQQQQQQPWHEGLQQLVMHQHVQLLDEQQEEQQPDSPYARELSRSPSPREPFSPGMMAVKGRSRSRTPSPSSSQPCRARTRTARARAAAIAAVAAVTAAGPAPHRVA